MSIRDSILRYTTGGYEGMSSDRKSQLLRFVVSQLNSDGGFISRDGCSDLYYTVFGLQLLRTMGRPIHSERLSGYLQGAYKKLPEMDLIETASLGRCFGFLPMEYRFFAHRDKIARHISGFVAADGSYAIMSGSETGSSYAAFLAVGALQDMELEVGNSQAIVASLAKLALADGSFVNDISMPVGLVPTTAAAMVLLHIFAGSSPANSAQWLASCLSSEGGMSVTPGGEPDMLSTAVGMFALAYCGYGELITSQSARHTAEFVERLARPNGGYTATITDVNTDCEYAFYAMLIKGIVRGYG